MPQGHGKRCYGYESEDQQYAHCTRPEYAGALEINRSSQTFAHKLHRDCRCGVAHGHGALRSKVGTNGHRASTNEHKPQSAPVIRHEIRDSDGTLKAYHYRRGTGPDKAVWWGSPDGSNTLAGVPPEELLLYGAEHLPDLPDGAEVIVTEGEPAKDALERQGIPAWLLLLGLAVCPTMMFSNIWFVSPLSCGPTMTMADGVT